MISGFHYRLIFESLKLAQLRPFFTLRNYFFFNPEKGAYVVEESAVPCCPSNLHDARSNNFSLIVPHSFIDLEGASDALKRECITSSL